MDIIEGETKTGTNVYVCVGFPKGLVVEKFFDAAVDVEFHELDNCFIIGKFDQMLTEDFKLVSSEADLEDC